MKYTIIALFTLSLIFAGCSNDWLNDIEPQGKLLESNYYQTEAEMEKGLIASYNMFKNQYWDGIWSSGILLGSLASDDAVAHGGGPGDRPEFWDAQEYECVATTSGLLSMWKRSYHGVYRCNVVIERVDPTSDFGKIAIAEAKTLRAMFYFDLVRYFGEGPLIKNVLTPDAYIQPKAPKQEIFEFIVEDLVAAGPDLPTRWSGGDVYRMTKYGAYGLLSKVYAYMASPYNNPGGINTALWAESEKYAQMVIDDGGYALEADYDNIWWFENEFNNETLIEMSYGYSPGEYFGGGQESVSNVMQQLCGVRGIAVNDTLGAGWGFNMVTKNLVELYEANGDTERLNGTALAQADYESWGATGGDQNQDFSGYYNKKMASWKKLNPTNSADTWGWGNNERVLRLADIYLILAEAQIAQGKSGDAAINVVRDRVGLAPITGANLDALKLERRLELAMENNRFFDLVRWDDADAVLSVSVSDEDGYHHGGYAARNATWPIPQEEIDKSDGLLIQTAGY